MKGDSMAERPRIACPRCGTPMNFHAVKVDYGVGIAGATPDAEFGGTVAEFNTCPNPMCRFVLERPAK